MAPPIATPLPQRRGDGFTIMAGKLTTLFLDQFKAKSPTVEGLAHTTRTLGAPFFPRSRPKKWAPRSLASWAGGRVPPVYKCHLVPPNMFLRHP
jgi:hypothetical protein